MAPFLVAAFDIECVLATSRQGLREDGARARDLGGRADAGAPGEVFDDMEDAFWPSSGRDEGGRRARAQQGLPKTARASVLRLSTASTSRTTPNIIGSKLSNTEKIERLAELLNKLPWTRPQGRRHDPDRPHRQPHRQPRGG
jgi:hypothetical protein